MKESPLAGTKRTTTACKDCQEGGTADGEYIEPRLRADSRCHQRRCLRDHHRARWIFYWSRGAERITGYSAEDVVGKHCYDNVLVHTDLDGVNLCFNGCPLEACIASGIGSSVNEVFLKHKAASGWRST